MSRMVLCACGRVVKVGPEQFGQVPTCPRCGRVVETPDAGAGASRHPTLAPQSARPQPQPTRPEYPSSQRTPAAGPVPGSRVGSARPSRPDSARYTPSSPPNVARDPHPASSNNGKALWLIAGAIGMGTFMSILLIYTLTRPDKAPVTVAGVTPVKQEPARSTQVSVPAPTPIPTPAVVPPAPPASEGPRTTREIVSKNEASVAKMEGKFSTGTGFLVGPGIVATNAHVINGELVSNVVARFHSAPGKDQGPYPVKLIYCNPTRDLALVKIESRLPAIEVARSYSFQRGEDITIIGNPGGLGGTVSLENAITKGVLSTEATYRGQRWYQLSASVNPGNSGGPVLDSRGLVIGIVTLKALKEEGHSYCIPVDALTSALDEVSDITVPQRLQVERRHNVRSVFMFLTKSTANYIVACQNLISLAKANTSKANNAAEVKQTYEERRTYASNYHDRTRQDFSPALELILGESGTDAVVRNDLADLRRLLDRAKSMLDNPDGTIAEFEAKVKLAAEEFNKVTDRLSTALDVTF